MNVLDVQERILEHYDSPYHLGGAGHVTHVAELENATCGDYVRIELDVGDDYRIGEAWFQSRGCVISRAAASMLAEAIEGRSLSESAQFSAADMLELFGAPLTPLRRNCCLLSWRVLQQAIRQPKGTPSHRE